MPGNPTVANQMRKHAALMRRRGLRVSAMTGWEDRGRSATFTPRAVTYHHTAAAVDVDRLLRDGRPDLAGPLCNYAVHRDGSWVLVAAGRANHAGEGTLPSSASYGIEATGPNQEGATGAGAFDNYAAYVLGVACIFEVEGWSPSVGYGHKETARPLGRKVDPAFPIPQFEADISRAMLGQPSEEDEDLPLNPDDKKWIADLLVGTLRAAFAAPWDTETVGAAQNQVQQLLQRADATDDRILETLEALAKMGPPAQQPALSGTFTISGSGTVGAPPERSAP